jgi:hypothetical protein
MDENEYLENLMAESYKREIDQEENVVRSLPFVAVGLAVLSTIMIFVSKYIPEYRLQSYVIIVWGLLFLFGCLILLIIIYLLLAVSRPRFQRVRDPTELYLYSKRLEKYYRDIGRTPQQISEAVVNDMRLLMSQQYAICSAYNQAINFARSKARGRAFVSLVLAIALAFGIVVTISVHEAMNGSGGGERLPCSTKTTAQATEWRRSSP